MIDGVNELSELRGKVKWFDPAKGFGFILDGEGGPDILLHANVLRNFGQGSVADNALISVRVQKTPRGRQAVEVLQIDPPENSDDIPPIEDLDGTEASDLENLPLEPVRVKWFDKVKGFGFANVFGRSEDVFIHIEVLRRSGFADLAPGEAVCLKVIEGRRGRMAAQVLSWESGLRS
ncbi:cold shock domain-containing protein [Thioclava sp. GXIMD4216]|uniref:Cold shock domain-containing protein n=1 Tax=Thioclava litoralis TaxID=3076557 RepID=A0ABZ1DWS5_9RHOB|nr:cold shock domain-containing protein [Thioclava sp. FTW29]